MTGKKDVLSRVGIPSMHILLSQCCLYWLGQVHRVGDCHVPMDLLDSELASGSWGVGRPQLCNKDVCKCDMKACDIDSESPEAIAQNRSLRKQQV